MTLLSLLRHLSNHNNQKMKIPFLILATTLLLATSSELFAQHHWAIAIWENRKEKPTIMEYPSIPEMSENGIENHRIFDDIYRFRGDSYTFVSFLSLHHFRRLHRAVAVQFPCDVESARHVRQIDVAAVGLLFQQDAARVVQLHRPHLPLSAGDVDAR